MIPLPDSLYLGIGSFSAYEANDVETILKGGLSTAEVMNLLSRHWKIKVWFNCEHEIRRCRHTTIKKISETESTMHYSSRNIKTNCHVFTRIFKKGNVVGYTITRRSRSGFYFPDMGTVLKYEPIIKRRK